MVKLRRGDLVLFGLSKINVDRLKEGKPIAFAGAPFGFPGVTFAIHYGDTELAIMAELQKVGLIRPGEIPTDDKEN